jgi:two-component system sensor histidine kinase and response regulator WspE
LDVVQSLMHEVGGAVRIESKAGEGATFHLTMPVTRSLMRVLIVEQDGESYAVPLVRIARVMQSAVTLSEMGAATANDGDHSIAVLPLIDVLGGGGGASIDPGQAMLLRLLDGDGSESELALQVDRIVGDATVAVRQLAARFGKMAGIAAVTLTEQGAPLLIVDPDSLLRSAAKLQQQRSRLIGPATDNRGRVLVVDDSPTVRQMLRRTLLRAGYAVTMAVHGAEGWGLLQVEQFDLLVSDVDMPEMNGIELVEYVRMNARIGAMPIILLSYKGREQDRQRGLEAGADAYVTKGEFEEAGFLQLVEDLIGPAQLPAATSGWHDEEEDGGVMA